MNNGSIGQTHARRINYRDFWIVPCILFGLLFIAAVLIWNDPQPYTLSEARGESRIIFSVNRTRLVFPGECVAVSWQLEGVREVYIYGEGVAGTGEYPAVCTGDAPHLRAVFPDGSEAAYTLPRDVWMMQPLPALGGVLLLIAAVVAFTRSRRIARLTRSRAGEYVGVALTSTAFVLLLPLYTRAEYITIGYTLDAGRTLEIARNGLFGNPELIAPWAYRPLTPLVARALADGFGQSVETGFALVTLIGMAAFLTLVYALARQFTTRRAAAWACWGVAGVSFWLVRFSLSDIYRPDSLAYALILAAMLLLIHIQRQTYTLPLRAVLACAVLCAVGVWAREFLAIPAILLLIHLAQRAFAAFRTRDRRSIILIAACAMLTAVLLAAAILLPRLFIPVAGSLQVFDPQNRPDETAYRLLQPLQNGTRNVEIVMNALVFLLPALILITPARVRESWQCLRSLCLSLILYTILVMLLVWYGGSGVQRYITYLVVPLIILLAIWLPRARRWEWASLLIILALANRLFWMNRVDPFANPLFLGEAADAAVYLPRIAEMLFYITLATTCRLIFARRSPIAPHPLPTP